MPDAECPFTVALAERTGVRHALALARGAPSGDTRKGDVSDYLNGGGDSGRLWPRVRDSTITLRPLHCRDERLSFQSQLVDTTGLEAVESTVVGARPRQGR